MSRENLEIVRRLLEACNRRDFEAMLETGDPEIEIVTLMTGTYRGHAGWRQLVEEMADEVSGFQFVPEDLIDVGQDRVVAVTRWVGTGSTSGIAVPDTTIGLVYTLRDGLVVRQESFRNRDEALKVVGLEEWAMPEESTTPDLAELVRHLLDAASCMGGDAFVRFFAPDAVFLTGVGRFEGRDAIRGYIDEFNSSYDEQSFAPDEVHDLGNGVAWFSAVVTGRPRGVSADVHLRFAVVVTHAGGVVSQWTDYVTIDEARAVAERLAQERADG